MNQRLLPILLIAGAVALAGCQGPAPRAAGARYPQRDLTAPWPERHYWPVPPSSFPAPPTAAEENAGRAPDALPATAAPDALPAARPLQPAPRTRLGRVPRTACAPRGC
jgi:hypothetical protein